MAHIKIYKGDLEKTFREHPGLIDQRIEGVKVFDAAPAGKPDEPEKLFAVRVSNNDTLEYIEGTPANPGKSRHFPAFSILAIIVSPEGKVTMLPSDKSDARYTPPGKNDPELEVGYMDHQGNSVLAADLARIVQENSKPGAEADNAAGNKAGQGQEPIRNRSNS